MDAIVKYLPSPIDVGAVTATATKTGDPVLRKPTVHEPVCALAFKVQNQKITGPLVFLRVYSGILQKGMQLLNTTRGIKERPTKLWQVGPCSSWVNVFTRYDPDCVRPIRCLLMSTARSQVCQPGRLVLLLAWQRQQVRAASCMFGSRHWLLAALTRSFTSVCWLSLAFCAPPQATHCA